jgi:4-coumarate--CoA ligase
VNYGRILQLSVKLASQLKEAGIKKGDVISILSQNQWKYQLTIVSGFYIGAKVNLLNPDYTPGVDQLK